MNFFCAVIHLLTAIFLFFLLYFLLFSLQWLSSPDSFVDNNFNGAGGSNDDSTSYERDPISTGTNIDNMNSSNNSNNIGCDCETANNIAGNNYGEDAEGGSEAEEVQGNVNETEEERYILFF
jgi:hypothetical protein